MLSPTKKKIASSNDHFLLTVTSTTERPHTHTHTKQTSKPKGNNRHYHYIHFTPHLSIHQDEQLVRKEEDAERISQGGETGDQAGGPGTLRYGLVLCAGVCVVVLLRSVVELVGESCKSWLLLPPPCRGGCCCCY